MKRLLAFHDEPEILAYENVRVFSRRHPGYPNPTLNHLELVNYFSNCAAPKKFIDLGCGVGLLGNAATVYGDTEKFEVIFADLNPYAVNQSVQAYQLNHKTDLRACPGVRTQTGFRIDTGKHVLEARVGDVSQTFFRFDGQGARAVAAPMFIPVICEVFPQAFDLFALVAKHIGATLYFGHSNLVLDMVKKAAEKNKMKVRSEPTQTIPFNPEYYSSEQGLQVDYESLAPFGLEIVKGSKVNEYYHRLMISELS